MKPATLMLMIVLSVLASAVPAKAFLFNFGGGAVCVPSVDAGDGNSVDAGNGNVVDGGAGC